MAKRLVTTGAAAHRLGLSPERVRQLEREGVIRATRTENGVRLFSLDDVDRLADKRASKAARRTA